MNKKSPLKAADATLVQAAFAHGRAQVPQYDKEAVKTEAGLGGDVMAGVDRGIKSIQEQAEKEELEQKKLIKEEKAQKKKQSEGFHHIYDNLNRTLSADGGMDDKYFNRVSDDAELIRVGYQECNTVGDEDTPENRKCRAEQLGKLDKLVNDTYATRSIFQEIGTMHEDPGSSFPGSKDEALLTLLGDQGVGGSYESGIVTPGSDENGNPGFKVILPLKSADGKPWGGFTEYTGEFTEYDENDVGVPGKEIGVPGTEITQFITTDDMAGMFYPSASGEKAAFINSAKANMEMAIGHENETPWVEFNEQDYEDDIYNIVMDPIGDEKKNVNQVVSDLLQSRLDGNPGKGYGKDGGPPVEGEEYKYDLGSFGQAMAHIDVLDYGFYEELAEDGLLDIEDVDSGDGKGGDPDGIITKEEVRKFYAMNTENKNMVIDAMVDHKNENFDAKRSARAFANWRMQQQKKIYNDTRTGQRAKLAGEAAYKREYKLLRPAKTPTTPPATIDLPWGEGLPKPKSGSKGEMQLNAVNDILNNQSRVRVENDWWTLQTDGNYKKTDEVVSGTLRRIDYGENTPPIRTKIDLVREAGGPYGNIPSDYYGEGETTTPDKSVFEKAMGWLGGDVVEVDEEQL